MNESRISVRYAKAVFEVALDKGVLKEVGEDMAIILNVSYSPDFRIFAGNPAIPPSKKKEIFHAAFENELNPVTFSLTDLVIANGREGYLAAIARNFIALSKKEMGITDAEVTTAVGITEQLRSRLKKVISDTFSTRAEIKEFVDPAIIGGFVVRIEDNLFDASVRTKLKKIGKELGSRAEND
jgi:F-type H+-transporting ATPase subunit delta